MTYQTKPLTALSRHGDAYSALLRSAAPGFMRQAADHRIELAMQRFADYQLVIVTGDEPIGAALAIPLYWDDVDQSMPASLEEVMIRAVGCQELKKVCNALFVLAVAISERYAGNGLRLEILAALKRLARDKGLGTLVAAVRPARKSNFPLAPFDQYVNWKQPDGSPFDPELQVHWQLGASVLGTMPLAVTVEGGVAQWERWTDVCFAESGEYLVDGAQRPVLIDRDRDHGYYGDPQVWLGHQVMTTNGRPQGGGDR
ncbi:MAG: hypothetical protein QNJ22_19405 [Desulfosarcinaceae bacterium]|nr:hypothetical protein [Desulfosarcinaceae bacterium]